MSEKIAVLITTIHRGVFFGYVNPDDLYKDVIEVERMRCCVSWAVSTKGFLGLATYGPNKESRVGPAPPRAILRGVTSVAECTPEAVKAWEAAPWN